MPDERKCINCGRKLIRRNDVWLCLQCNSGDLDYTGLFKDDPGEVDHIFIECPGATLYEQGTNNVVAGVEFIDNDGNDGVGHRIVGRAIYAPNHNRRRRIKKEALGSIRRCEACQDYTVRMRRKEGADFFIPSSKHPHRKKLKSIQHVTYEP